jgi:alanyl-tRNA synthetase
MKAAELRRVWTEFWTERDHVLVPSAGLIPHHPTAPMFTNSGMMQFVPYFLGEEQPPFKRAQSIQKCARIGGKHNDIDEVGRTNRHLTFFEMLGNWSFGDYFKEDAIRWSWELLTEVVGFDGDRIWITVHETDDEAEAIWHEQVGVPMERIQRMGKDNFWEMGDTGPCGPSTEMHWDLGGPGPGAGPAGDETRYSEIWNDVFMTYFRQPDASLVELPSKNVDTGAGFERWLMLLDDVPTIFDTDAVRPIIRVAEELTKTTYGGGEEESDVALRVIGDHARTMTFLVNDGVVPSNEGRGYVLRGVIRRAVRRAYSLGAESTLVGPDLVAAVVEHMGDAYPEIRENADAITATIEREEGRFRQTLKAGSTLLAEVLDTGSVPGEVAFKLHDTYGFPIEITQEAAEERGVAVDRAGFDAAMEEQRTRSRESLKRVSLSADAGDAYRQLVETNGPTEFTGREENESKAHVLGVLPGAEDGIVEVFLDRTPFYAESGGQVGDTGTITGPNGRAEVLDTTAALPGLHRHHARIIEGEIAEGDEVAAAIDADRRDAIRRNHTATHLLHWALREVLGSHVKQQGSLVGPDHLRFDFSHHEAMTPEQIAAVEDLTNAEVLRNDPVRHYETTKEEALNLGAIAFFGDKYGDVVRVLEAGRQSTELCGGTHVGATGDIGPVKITSEGSIGANQRRIFATTGTGTLARFRDEEQRLDRAASLLGVPPDEVVEGVERLREEVKALRDELKVLRRQAASSGAADLAAAAVDGVVVARSDGGSREELKDLAVAVREQPGIKAVVLVGEPDAGGVALVAAVAKGSGYDAPALIKDAAKAVGGGGGGKGDIATAGGRDADKIDEALDLVRVAADLPTGTG